MASKTAPIEFLRQVRQEVSKVTWPSRRETITSTIMVLLMVVFMAVFFFLIDQVLSVGIRAALGLGD
tara:strand:+ start:23 stop:223 length:201 start_codon:yes stop_codon:yes gene_type:complete